MSAFSIILIHQKVHRYGPFADYVIDPEIAYWIKHQHMPSGSSAPVDLSNAKLNFPTLSELITYLVSYQMCLNYCLSLAILPTLSFNESLNNFSTQLALER